MSRIIFSSSLCSFAFVLSATPKSFLYFQGFRRHVLTFRRHGLHKKLLALWPYTPLIENEGEIPCRFYNTSIDETAAAMEDTTLLANTL